MEPELWIKERENDSWLDIVQNGNCIAVVRNLWLAEIFIKAYERSLGYVKPNPQPELSSPS